MGSTDPLRIGVSVDVSQMSKLADAARTVADSTGQMTTQFNAAGTSAREVAAAAADTAAKMVSSSSAIQQLSERLVGLKLRLAEVQAAAKESFSEIAAAGGAAGVTASYFQNYNAELAQAAILQKEVTATEKEFRTALSESYIGVQNAAAAQQAAAAAQTEAAAQQAVAMEAAADATAQDTAANEGMVSSDLAVASEENAVAEAMTRRAIASREASASAVTAARAVQETTGAEGRLALAVQMANQMMTRGGMTTQETAKAMQGAEFTALEISAAFQQLGKSFQGVTGASEPARKGIAAMGMAAGQSRVALGALMNSSFETGYGLMRMALQSQAVRAALDVAFPVFGAIALAEVVGDLARKLDAWSFQIEKADMESAKFQRTLDASVETLDQAEERIAANVGPLAALAEQEAHAADKVVDLSSEVTALNKQLDSAPTLWKRFGEEASRAISFGISGAIPIFGEADAATKAMTVSTEAFEMRLAAGVKTSNDYGWALTQIDQQINLLQADIAKMRNIPFMGSAVAEAQGQIALLQAQREDIERRQEAVQDEALAQRQKGEEDLAASEKSLGESRLAFEQTQIEAITRLHLGSIEDQRAGEERLAEDKRNIDLADVARHRAILDELAASPAGRGVDFTVQRRALADEAAKIEQDYRNKILSITLSTDESVQSRDLQLAEAEIEANSRIAESEIKLAETKERTAFTRADSITEIQSTAIPLIETTNRLYREQITVLQERAAALEKSLPETVQRPTAAAGTGAFAGQLTAVRAVAPQIADELESLNAQIIALQNEQASAVFTIEDNKNEKIKRVREQSLDDQIASLGEQLDEQRTIYQAETTNLETNQSEKRESWRRYYADTVALAQGNFRQQLLILAQEVSAVKDAAAQGVITQTDASKKITEINKQAEDAFRQMQEQELSIARQTLQQWQTESQKAADVIGSTFTRTFDVITTQHERLNIVAVRFWDNMVSGWDRMGLQIIANFAQAMGMLVVRTVLTEVGITTAHAQGVTVRSALDQAYVQLQSALGIQTTAVKTAQEAEQTAVHASATAQRQAATMLATTTEQTLKTTSTVKNIALDTTETTTHVANQTAQAAATTASQTAQTAAATSGASSRGAVGIAEDIGSILRAAAVAAANAVKWVFETVPFPANIGIAAAAGAAAYGLVKGFQSFEHGGIVKANLHEGEMVLPSHISRFVTTAASAASGLPFAGGGTSNYRTTHNHVNVVVNQNGGSMSQDDIVEAVRRGVRMGA